MDCRHDVEFHDDSIRAVEKAKESILLMKKKMFRSHDLILQYNNKLKEFDRLKGELFSIQEEATKLRQENKAYYAKVVKLESQIADYKKNQLDLESRISDQDVKIAGDKCHLEQLICKLESLEDKKSGMLIEANMVKTTLEGKIKELEQELRKVKKAQAAESQKIDGKIQRGRKTLTENHIIEKETVEIGINTEEEMKPEKPSTADRSVLTNEFYHVKDNPYPIFCDKCEALTTPNVENFCKMMTNIPPLLDAMSSPPAFEETSTFSMLNNFEAPVESVSKNMSQEYHSSFTISPEIENLKRKIMTLERKMKKRNKKISRESSRPSSSCCGHSHSSNCCSSYTLNHATSMPNVVPNVQVDLMNEFWNRIMNESASKLNEIRQNQAGVKRKKSIKLNNRRAKILMKKKKNYCLSSTNWEVESDECANEMENDIAEEHYKVSSILRLQPRENEDKKSTKLVSNDRFDDSFETERKTRSRSAAELSKKQETTKFAGRKKGEADNVPKDNIRSKKKLVEDIKVSRTRSSPRIHEKTLRNRENEDETSFSANDALSTSSDLDNSDISVPQLSIKHSLSLSSESIIKDQEISETVESSQSRSSEITTNIGSTVLNSSSSDVRNIAENDPCTKPDKKEPMKKCKPDIGIDFDPDVTISNNYSDQKIGKSKTELFDEDSNDAQPECRSDREMMESNSFVTDEINTRKRKRVNSPQGTKRTVKSELLVKMRSLKKNNIIDVPRTSSSLSRVFPQTEKSGNEVNDEVNENCTKDEPVVEVAAKRQRIAHIPKKSLNEERNVKEEFSDVGEKEEILLSKQLQSNVEENVEKLMENLPNAEGIQESITHDAIGDNPSENNSSCKNAEHFLNTLNPAEIIKTDFAASNTKKLCKDKISGKNSKFSDETAASDNLSTNEEIGQKCTKTEVADTPNNYLKTTSEITEDKNAVTQRTNQVSEIRASRQHALNSAETMITRGSIPKLPTSLRRLTSANILGPPKSSRINRPVDSKEGLKKVQSIEPSSSHKTLNSINFDHEEKTSTISGCLNDPLENLEKTDTAEWRDEKPKLPNGDNSMDISPASPDDSLIGDRWDKKKSPAKIPEDNVSIYENVIPPASMLFDDNLSSKTVMMQKRTLLRYDTDMLENYQEDIEETDSRITSKSQYSQNNDDSVKEKNHSMQNIVKDLRTRQILCSPESLASNQPNREKIQYPSDDEFNKTIDSAASQRGIRTLGTLLSRHLTNFKKKATGKSQKLRRTAAIKLLNEAEKTVKDELDRLVTSSEWTSDLHAGVIAKLSQAASQKTVAKSIVELLIERATIGETLDRTHTPPAPVMTQTQQRIAALINGLERVPGMSGISELIRTGIDFNLFRLGYSIQVEVTEALARMSTVIARMKKDRESARILCCDALYFLGRKAPNVIQIVLSIWPEVFPAYGTRLDPLVNCIVHLMRSENSPKASSVKRLLRDYYKYPENPLQSKILIQGSMNALTENYTGELEASILLIAKWEGTSWAYNHVVNGGLMKILEDSNYKSPLSPLTLLGFILRTFPIEDENKILSSMVEKLCLTIESVDGSPEREEGIISILLSLSRYAAHFNKIADTILKWKPNKPMRGITIEQLNTFFKLRSLDWWNKRKRDKLQLKVKD